MAMAWTPPITPSTTTTQCRTCQHIVPLSLLDCPWCGTSLANGYALKTAFSPSHASYPDSFHNQYVSVAKLRQQGLPLTETTYLSVGGGLGSFAWIDHLRIYGAQPEQMMTIGFEPKPYGRYRRLCLNSQIDGGERLRSNSDSCPDNMWGWPGYAVREAWQSLQRGALGHAASLLWQIFGEPMWAETYTPRSSDVFAAIDREAKRIGWAQIWRRGRVNAIRKTDDGRYLIAYSPLGRQAESLSSRYIIASYVHLAVGYPAIRLLPDLYAYRQRTGDFWRVVNAYEPHTHLYEQLRKQGGTVLIRGRGIVASRIIEQLYHARQQNPKVAILHLMRSPIQRGHRFRQAQRRVKEHWELQIFNWPKAAWGGDLRTMLAHASDGERDRLLDDWGGTTTAIRSEWQKMIQIGLQEGWYQRAFGEVVHVEDNRQGKVITYIKGEGSIKSQLRLEANFIIDATGLDAELGQNPLLTDMMQHYRLNPNPKGRLPISDDFEVVGMRNEYRATGPNRGRLYASGIMTLGGPYAPVDTFLGLQYAAVCSVDALTLMGAPGLAYLDGLRSLWQWGRWVRGVAP